MSKANQGLNQQQQQQLRLNQKQMLLGRLLEMSTPEFEEEIVRAMEENPAITTLDNAESDEPIRNIDGNSDDDFDDEERDYAPGPSRRTPDLRQTAAASSQAEAVEAQLDELPLTGLERETAHYIIGNLDSSGYLTRSATSIADDMALTAGIEVDPRLVEKIIKVVKTLDPAGIGAANLRECLLLQLDRMEQTPTVRIAEEIIGKHYKTFVNNRLDTVREAIGGPEAEFECAIKIIRSLNPKPGSGLFDHDGDERTRHITPDFIIEVDDAGRTSVYLAGKIPDLAIAPTFILDPEHPVSPTATEFIKERADGAEEFIEAVRRRGSTLMSIMSAIMRLQPEFFRSFEPRDLRPMVIRDIEAVTGLDKSVISRATSTKYMLTPDGIFPLKALFSESASAMTEVSVREVEDALKRLVDKEDKTQPLSDDELTAALNANGLTVARRTVAKYRERLGIPVARLRKRTI